MMKNVLFFLIAFQAFVLIGQNTANCPYVAGFRASRILSSYPNNQFPNQDYWTYVGHAMAEKFDSTCPAAVWIVSLYQSNGNTKLNFPSNGSSYPYIQFSTTDQNEAYLSRFDQEGFKVWLQVEPGAANIDTLMSLVMNRYKHHPCVVGFGIDVEWLNTHLYSGGQHVNDYMAQHWENYLKNVDSTYTLFLKHYSYNWMPPSYRGNILFIDDSQGFSSLNAMKNEFKAWGNHFPANKVAFQVGYKADTVWWKQYADPPLAIGNTLRSNIPNYYGLFWVDFTICQIFDISVDIHHIAQPSFEYVMDPFTHCIQPNELMNYTYYVITDLNGKVIEKGSFADKICLSSIRQGFYLITFANHQTAKTYKLLIK